MAISKCFISCWTPLYSPASEWTPLTISIIQLQRSDNQRRHSDSKNIGCIRRAPGTRPAPFQRTMQREWLMSIRKRFSREANLLFTARGAVGVSATRYRRHFSPSYVNCRVFFFFFLVFCSTRVVRALRVRAIAPIVCCHCVSVEREMRSRGRLSVRCCHTTRNGSIRGQ